MPTYDYRCDACGHGYELFQSIKADPEKVCPECGADTARRVIGAGGGLIFKGSGFYITDYARSKDYKEKSKSESDTSSATKSAGSTESKPSEPSKPAESKAPGSKASGGSTGSSAGSGASAAA